MFGIYYTDAFSYIFVLIFFFQGHGHNFGLIYFSDFNVYTASVWHF